MGSPSSALCAEDGVVTNREKASPFVNPKTRSLENGMYRFEFMKNGKPRPSAVRDFPEGVVPLHCKQTNALPFPEKKKQTQISPTETLQKMPSMEKKASVQGTEQARLNSSQEQEEAINAEEEQREKTSEQQEEKKVFEKRIEQSKKGRLVKKKPGTRDMPESLMGLSNPRKLVVEQDVVPATVHGIEQANLNVLQRPIETMDVENQQEEETVEKVQKQSKEEMVVETVGEQAKNSQPVMRKSGIRDLPDSLTTHAKKKVAKEGAGQEHLGQESDMEMSLSKATKAAIEMREAMDAEKDLKEETMEKVIEQQDEKKVSEKVTEQSNEARLVKRKAGIRDMPDRRKLVVDKAAAPTTAQGGEQANLVVLQGETEAMDVEKQQDVEKVNEQSIEGNVGEIVGEQTKKTRPVKRKSGIRDMPKSLTIQAKKKVAKEGLGQERFGHELETEESPSIATQTAKEKVVAMDIERKQKEEVMEKVAEKQEEKKVAEKVIEQSNEARLVKRKPGIRDMPEPLMGPSNQRKLVMEKEAAPTALQGTDQAKISVLKRKRESMDVKKKQDEGTLEKVIEQRKEEKDVDKVEEQTKKAMSVKKIRDLPDSLATLAKTKVAKEGVAHQESEMEMSLSIATQTAKGKSVADNAKLNGNAELLIAKHSGSGQKKRAIEVPNSSEKSKKLQKLKPTIETQTPEMAKKVLSPAKAKEKELNFKTIGKVVTPKSTKKLSNPSESSKKVKRSAGNSVRSVTLTMDTSDARKLVVESLRLYDAVRRKMVQDEEKNGKQGRGSRADLQAATLLKGQNASRGNEKGYGPLPGVLVGDIFLFRTELSFARVHGPIQAGIAYLTSKDSEFNTPVAISIISNVAQDGEDHGEELVYTGQGGRSLDNKQIADQKLERGNLALDGSRRFNIPVRILRGIKDVNSPTGKIYMYDGLYDVQETYTAKGSGGFNEFKFRLQRRADQPELGSDMLKLAADIKSQPPFSRKDVVIEDISKGKESQAICVENIVDDDKGPADFQYATQVIYPKDLAKPHSSAGCKCLGACTPSSDCSCFERNGDEFPYLNGGYLVREKDFVYECGSNCSCSSTCRNRTFEKGLKFRLDVFKTTNRGWGVRSLEMIPAGSFVCEYVGKMVADEQVAKDLSDRKLILCARWLPEMMPRWGDVPSSIISDRPRSTTRPDAGKPELIIDASHVGNVARFINHSCAPNLLVQKVLSDHQDVRYPQFKLFAMDNIPPLTELTFDYGHPPDQELGGKQLDCLCGSSDCRGKLYV